MASGQNETDVATKPWQSFMSDDDDIPDSDHPGDYSTRMGELFDDEDTDPEEFVYTGVDADTSTIGYHDQLRDILGQEAGEVYSPADEASQTSIRTAAEVNFEDHILSDLSERHISPNSSADSTSMTLSEPIVEQSVPTHVRRIKSRHPFLHPSVSRLRSYTPRSASRTPSDLSMASIQTPPGATPASSHFSTMSQASSLLFDFPKSDNANKETSKEREVFKWAELSSITQRFSSRPSQKANSVLGTRPASRSTALAANGMICVGTEDGSVHVFDFMQTPRCVCGTDLNGAEPFSALNYWAASIDTVNSAKEKTVGRVTAVALSHDHTYVASGHSTGHIFLYNLSEPNTPARSIPPTTLSGVVSGRKEGHLQGSRIVNIGFIGGRHTAIVSADEHGLAFYHNLSKVLFVEAFDTLRILGRYPEVDQPVNGHSLSEALKRRKPKFTVLASSPLPLGTSPHATDNYQVIALLTPTKLVVVGLRPSPKTWFKCPRGVDEDTSKSGSLGTLAWFPSMASPLSGGTKVPDKNIVPDPMLVYTWGNYVHLIKVTEVKAKQTVAAGQKGKTVEIGIIVHEEVCKWSTQEDIDAVQWLNANQIVVITTTALQVFDAYKGTVIEHVPFDVSSLVSPLKPPIANGDTPKKNTYHVVAHSVRVYKSKIFLLSRDRLQVGTLMTWADQILSCVEDGDFLGAIELARSYYVDEAPGNRNGLPLDAEGRRGMIGERMRGLMRASTQYAFSEERMTDDTHVTPDHRGVDRTSLFEDLVTVSCRACIALDDFEFLYEDLFQEFDDAGVARIYLLQLQPFILDNSIRYVPPRITQRLVALHEDDGRPDQIERIIWHIDPACLDINQAIRLCQVYRLYDALSYVYTCALRDYVSPIVEFLGIIRQKLLADYINVAQSPSDQDLFENAYKIYPYLETILTGHIYPSNEPLEESDSLTAKKDVYSFLFSGRSRTWPETDGGQLILTSLEEGGDEPPYPYVRQLLSFDSEWFLHTLDNAFEKAFLDEDLRQICQSITQVLLEIVSSKDVEPDDATFVRIFIARNVPKYSQFLHLSPRCSHSVLVSLAEDQDPETREDRQLAAESLLSIYHPDDLEDILRLFNEAGFYRILRQCYLHDHRWSALLTTYLDDAFLGTSEAVLGIADTFTSAQNSSRGVVPAELLMMLDCRLSDVLSIDIGSAAVLVNKYQPKLHDTAIELLEDDIKRFRYLRQLLGPVLNEEHTINISRTVPRHLSHMYLSLQCRFEPNKVIDVLQTLPPEALDWDQVLRTCETAEVYEAVVWALNWRGDSQGAIARADTYQKQLIARALGLDAGSDACDLVKATEAVVRMSITVCLQYSSGDAATSSQAEDLWFQLFRSQVYCIQLASGTPADDITPVKSHPLELLPWLRLLVQETFDSFVSVASENTVSFPRLFKRLVESVSASSNAHYTEFRSILTGMVESYRSDGDMLLITKHLVLRDLFEVMASHSRERVMGWAPSTMTCIHCRKPIQVIPGSTGDTQTSSDSTHYEIVVSRTGTLYHLNCSPTV
ncbi:hypothetical protein APHAL10511_004900 [Amanita phalloides]|nr:hypothetical protein APHAL10511_004900 [Amanita phalloides]